MAMHDGKRVFYTAMKENVWARRGDLRFFKRNGDYNVLQPCVLKGIPPSTTPSATRVTERTMCVQVKLEAIGN